MMAGWYQQEFRHNQRFVVESDSKVAVLLGVEGSWIVVEVGVLLINEGCESSHNFTSMINQIRESMSKCWEV